MALAGRLDRCNRLGMDGAAADVVLERQVDVRSLEALNVHPGVTPGARVRHIAWQQVIGHRCRDRRRRRGHRRFIGGSRDAGATLCPRIRPAVDHLGNSAGCCVAVWRHRQWLIEKAEHLRCHTAGDVAGPYRQPPDVVAERESVKLPVPPHNRYAQYRTV